MDTKNTETENKLELIWGAANIGKVCNLSERQAFHALETGAIPGRKSGGKWVAEHGKLRDFFLESAGG